MSITGVSTSQANQVSALQNKQKATTNLFQRLGDNLKQGDIGGARKIFAAITRQIKQAEQASAGNHQGKGGSAAAISGRKDFAALASALKSGNISSAQQAYSALTGDLKAYSQLNQSSNTAATAAQKQGGGLNGGSLHLTA